MQANFKIRPFKTAAQTLNTKLYPLPIIYQSYFVLHILVSLNRLVELVLNLGYIHVKLLGIETQTAYIRDRPTVHNTHKCKEVNSGFAITVSETTFGITISAIFVIFFEQKPSKDCLKFLLLFFLLITLYSCRHFEIFVIPYRLNL